MSSKSPSNTAARTSTSSLPQYADAATPPAYTVEDASSVVSKGSTSKSMLRKMFHRGCEFCLVFCSFPCMESLLYSLLTTSLVANDAVPSQSNKRQEEAEARERKNAVLAMYYATR